MQIDRERLARALCLANSGPFIFMDERGKAAVRREVDFVLDDIENQGFVIVPREPTEAIVEAACRAEAKHQGFDYDAVTIGDIRTAMESCRRIWNFLIEAGK